MQNQHLFMTHLPPSTSVLYLQATDERFFDAIWANATAASDSNMAFLRTLQQANYQYRAQILSEQPIHTADVCYALAQRGLFPADFSGYSHGSQHTWV